MRTTPELPDENQGALTPIPSRIHYTATPDTTTEVDDLMVQHFLDTLAEIAAAIAARREQQTP